jgi:hypothetical protein
MTDIPALIERLRKEVARATAEDGKECCYSPWACCDPRVLVDAADELSRLTASPLPKEIAELTEDLRYYKTKDCDCPECQTIEGAAAALERMAQEIERLRKELSAEYQFQTLLDLRTALEQQATRIKELEAERDRLQAELRVCYKLPLTMGHPIAQKLAAERDAIEAELRKIACFIEPHWQGAGAKLQAEWMIRAISRLNSERDELEAECDAIQAATIERAVEAVEWYRNVENYDLDNIIGRLRRQREKEND